MLSWVCLWPITRLNWAPSHKFLICSLEISWWTSLCQFLLKLISLRAHYSNLSRSRSGSTLISRECLSVHLVLCHQQIWTISLMANGKWRETCSDLCTSKLGHSMELYSPGMYLFLSYGEKEVIFNQIYVIVYIISDDELHNQHPHSFLTLSRQGNGCIQRQLSNTPLRRHIHRNSLQSALKPVMVPHWWPRHLSLAFKGAVPNLTLTCLSSCVFCYPHTQLPFKPSKIADKPLTLIPFLPLPPASSRQCCSLCLECPLFLLNFNPCWYSLSRNPSLLIFYPSIVIYLMWFYI